VSTVQARRARGRAEGHVEPAVVGGFPKKFLFCFSLFLSSLPTPAPTQPHTSRQPPLGDSLGVGG
jgi:hypothetical protein